MELSRLHNKDALVEIITQNLNSHLENLPDDLERKGNGASIYRIPDHIKKVHPKAFKPKRVSFGPYHHGELHLSPMEKMKHLALRYFERRCGLCVEDIVNELWDMLEDLQRSYDKLDDEWKKKPTKFLEVMILDGCLMMQVLLEDTDVSKFTTTDVLRDMLLLENQLPMKLLDKLYLMSMPEHNKKVKSLVWEFRNLPTDVKKTLLERDYSHLLDMYRAELVFYKGNEWKPLQRSHLGMGHEIQLATRFHKAGIKFKKGCNLMDVYFDRKRGVLSLPFIEMNAHIESGLLNAMAFEKLYGIDNIVDSFVILMGNLMEKDEVDSFNQLAKGEVLGMWGHYTYVYNSVNEHCKRPWRIWWTTLKDVNFQSPWTIISTLSALIGFAFLIIQTVYGVYGYYLPRRS
ncbi:UPF0481 protein At3g47200-like [Cucurbita pepo subsp. pepo]|uniref:UPF0481 protein At3g47200-like n=1 Tax=Cucurbita pepo subsp. pepo TaxID=3664 RepID=UPI000C9D673C|nr:UPF0481 protein At3g47200-like [Cucurbita pepo subsp. pepo]